MRLMEFADNDPLRVKLVAVTNHIKARLADSDSNRPMNTDAFLRLLKNNDIIISKSDLFDIAKKDPLKNIIDDVNGHEITFKGQGQDEQMAPDAEENQKVVSQMAQRASGK